VLLCLGIVSLIWIPLGRRILAFLGERNLSAEYSLSVAMGMGAWGFCILLLGLAGLLYKSLVLAIMLVLLVLLRLPASAFTPAGEEPRIRPVFSRKPWDFIPVAFGLGYVLLVLGSTLAPEVAFDSLNVHLPYSRDAASAHRIGFSPNNWSSVMPALPLMSYVTAFLFSGLTLAKLFNLLCYIACGCVIYGFTKRWWGPTHAAAAALLFLSSPVALYEASTALIDLPLALYSAIVVFAFLEWLASGRRGYLWLTAISLGLALGCKYHAIFWVLPILVLWAWWGGKSNGIARRAQFRQLFYFCFIALLLFLPWLIRAWYYTGNPVFPAANGIFKSPYFTPAMEAAAQAAYENEGAGRSFMALLQLPLTVTFHPGPFRGTLGFLFLPGIALALLRSKTPQVRYGAFFAAAYFYLWAVTAQEIRYLLPLLPIVSVLAAVGFLGSAPILIRTDSRAEAIKSWGSRLSAYAGMAIILAGGVTALPVVYLPLVKEWTYWHSYQSPLPYLLGRQSAQEFVSREVPSIYVYDFVNRNLGPADRILLLNDAAQFYSQVPTLYSFTVEGEQILMQSAEERVVQKLKESRISHVLLNYNGIAPVRGVAPRLGVYFFLDKAFQERYLDPQYSRNNVVLYRIRPS
jgi:hypothetical protein